MQDYPATLSEKDETLIYQMGNTSPLDRRSSFQALAATGSTIADAAVITVNANGQVQATAGDGTKGVLLPAPGKSGFRVEIKNNAAAVLKVYPQTGATINALSASAAISMAANTSCFFDSVSATAWFTTPLLPS